MSGPFKDYPVKWFVLPKHADPCTPTITWSGLGKGLGVVVVCGLGLLAAGIALHGYSVWHEAMLTIPGMAQDIAEIREAVAPDWQP